MGSEIQGHQWRGLCLWAQRYRVICGGGGVYGHRDTGSSVEGLFLCAQRYRVISGGGGVSGLRDTGASVEGLVSVGSEIQGHQWKG